MGKKNEYERQSHFELKYTKGGQSKNALFGDHFIYTQKETNSKIICIEKLYNDRSTLNRSIEEIKKKILNKHDYILNLLDYSVEVQKNWCSTFYLLRVFYEYPDKSLKQMIIEKKQMNDLKEKDFKSEELTHLLYHQISANAYLQENSIPHGDVTPNTIFRTNKGEFKLAFRSNNMSRAEKVQLEKILKREPIYVSPALFSALKRRDLENIKHTRHKSDIYSLGLCILEAGLMHSVQSIYDNDQVNQGLVDNYLNEFEDKFEDNPLLFTSVRKMLENNEEDRADFVSLKEAMPDYEVICDYFYKVEHGLIDEEEEYDESFDDLSPGGNQYNFAPNQNFEVPPQDFHREQIHAESQNQYGGSNPNLKKNSIPQELNNQNQLQNQVSLEMNNYQNKEIEVNNQPQVQNNLQNQQVENTDDFFNFFDEPISKNPYFVKSTPNLQSTPQYTPPQPQYTQPPQYTPAQPQTQPQFQSQPQYKPLQNQPPQNPYQQPQQQFNQSIPQHTIPQQTIPQQTIPQQMIHQNSYQNYQNPQTFQSNPQSQEIKMINGVPHKSVIEIVDDVDQDGYLVQKKIMKYTPVNQSNGQVQQKFSSYSNSTNNNNQMQNSFSTNATPNTNYSNYNNQTINSQPQYLYQQNL